jgi:hypothetical protein
VYFTFKKTLFEEVPIKLKFFTNFESYFFDSGLDKIIKISIFILSLPTPEIHKQEDQHKSFADDFN